MRLKHLVLLSLLGTAPAGPLFANVTFLDAQINDQAWYPYAIIPGSFVQLVSGNFGHPGSCASIGTSLPGNAGPGGEFDFFNHNNIQGQPYTYSPQSGGAIVSVAASEDLLYMAGAMSVAPGLIQNGKIYYADVAAHTATHTYWLNFSDTLTAASYHTYASATDHPDFSATGASIDFGFVTANPGAGTLYSPVPGYPQYDSTSWSVGLDNWKVIVNNTVPEPSAVALLALGACALGVWRRR